MKHWFDKKLTHFSDWFAGKIHTPRLWSKKEWGSFTSKEKIWIWYKHHDNIMSTGNGELDKLLPFLKGEFLTTTGIFVVILNQLQLPPWTYFLYPLLYVGYKFFQWYVGDQIDKRDLIAIASDVSNKRNLAFRELREKKKKEAWRSKQKA